ncbi:MAG: stress response protein [Planctomycetota bacterium]|nr:MAG: stress response protein [Planctomycetota bacterium]
MAKRIEQDHWRFRQIVRGHIKKNLRKYMSQGEILVRKGKDVVSVPIPQIEIPRFRYGKQQGGGVGQGEGEAGQPIGGQGPGAGEAPGEHPLEVEVTLEELAEIMAEELELPRIEPKGSSRLSTIKFKYTGISRVGPESLRHFKRTFIQALKRMICSGEYDPEKPIVIPVREDKRYRSWKVKHAPEARAVVIYMMDVSGSMGGEQKEIVRQEAFWIDTWIRYNYKNVEFRYLAHDAVAREVDRDTFFRMREGGGTKISSAYKLAATIIAKDYPPSDYNIYLFHFSDGDNWGRDDTALAIDIMKNDLLPVANLLGYGQVKSAYGSGQFIKDLRDAFKDDWDNLVLSEIDSRDDIYTSIKTFLGKGK